MYRACLGMRCIFFLRLLPEHVNAPTRTLGGCPCVNHILTGGGAGCRWQNLEQLLEDCFESELQRVVHQATCHFGLFCILKTEGESGSELHQILWGELTKNRTVLFWAYINIPDLFKPNTSPFTQGWNQYARSFRSYPTENVGIDDVWKMSLSYLINCAWCH